MKSAAGNLKIRITGRPLCIMESKPFGEYKRCGPDKSKVLIINTRFLYIVKLLEYVLNSLNEHDYAETDDQKDKKDAVNFFQGLNIYLG